MHSLRYISGGESVSLDGPATFAGTAAGIRGRAWAYSIGYRSLAGVSRPARECSLSVAFADAAEADRLRRLADRDMRDGTPGRLDADGWEQRCYIVKSEVGAVFGGYHSAELTVVLLDGVWRKGHTVPFELLTATAGDGEFLDLPYDLPYDLGVPSTRRYVDIAGWGAAPLRFTVYGPCVNPAIRIDGNWFRVDVTVPDGGYMVVDPLATPRSVTVVGPDGSVTDAFPKARRGDGLGGGEYVFQPVRPGTHEVEWDRSFGFDLTWYEEEGEPPWS
ncbi:hypothetical protein DW178_08500 [Eggerthella sp. AM16-19]|uniref:hypothetical protein n=1 Tax=Eggerthella sp. AM16-19 TaxID=2292042 RepID=UPI000E467343|nr:hypothetical protein [Eggerthella sp. AM16-19]RHO38299.1 hypothetical protein DW178_08500 [Eggerthella sp. AM16-19]